MDLFTHICSGVAAATVVIPFAKGKSAKPLKILGFGALGGAVPASFCTETVAHTRPHREVPSLTSSGPTLTQIS